MVFRRTRTASGSLFPDFQALQRIWTHPMVLKLNAEKWEKLNERKMISSDSEGSLKDFVVADSDVECTSGTSSASTVDDDDDDDVRSVDSNSKPKSTKSNARNNKLGKIQLTCIILFFNSHTHIYIYCFT